MPGRYKADGQARRYALRYLRTGWGICPGRPRPAQVLRIGQHVGADKIRLRMAGHHAQLGFDRLDKLRVVFPIKMPIRMLVSSSQRSLVSSRGSKKATGRKNGSGLEFRVLPPLPRPGQNEGHRPLAVSLLCRDNQAQRFEDFHTRAPARTDRSSSLAHFSPKLGVSTSPHSVQAKTVKRSGYGSYNAPGSL